MTPEPSYPVWDQIPFYRKGLVATLAMLLFIPLGLLIIWTGPVYTRRKGQVVPQRRRDKVILSVLGIVILVFNGAKFASGDREARVTEIPACSDPAVARTLKSAVKNSPVGKTRGVEVLQVESLAEVDWYPDRQVRNCAGSVVTNGGRMGAIVTLTWRDRTKGTWLLEFKLG